MSDVFLSIGTSSSTDISSNCPVQGAKGLVISAYHDDFYPKSMEEIIQPYSENIKDAAVSPNGNIYAVTTSSSQKCYKFSNGEWSTLPAPPTFINEIAVDNSDYLWGIGSNGYIYRLTGRSWSQMPGTGINIASNSNGTICLLASNDVYKWSGSYWASLGWTGSDWSSLYTIHGIAVDEKDNPWVITSYHYVSTYTGSEWITQPRQTSLISSLEDGSICIDGLTRWTGEKWMDMDLPEGYDSNYKLIGSHDGKYLILKDYVLYWAHQTENMLSNGDFSKLSDSWLDASSYQMSCNFDLYSYEKNVEEINDKLAVKIIVTDGGPHYWSSNFLQKPVNIQYGETYKVSFWAKKVGTYGTIMVTAAMSKSPWTVYGTKTITLSNNYKRYEFEFTMNEPTDANALLQFSVGKYSRDIYIDNVRIDHCFGELKNLTDSPLYEPWSASATYWGGDRVSYNGKNYEAKWWTQNETPGIASVWMEIE